MSKEKKSKTQKQNRAKKSPILAIAMSIVFCVVCVVAVLSLFQSSRLQRGLVDVCAAQQDAYVQLVLDQINLKQNRDNREIIEEILGTLDASSNKYWTFSDEDTMLFVKDILETNKYKGFTVSSYFVSETAKEFFEGLRLNKVSHSVIMVDDNQYIASGVMFNYGNEEYKLCLLTNRMVLLDNNQLLRARTELMVIIAGVTTMFAITTLVYARAYKAMQEKDRKQKKTLQEMNTHIQNLNNELTKWDIHDTRNNVWNKEALLGFAEKIQQRGVYPITLVTLLASDSEKMKRLMEIAHYVLDHNNLRFLMNDNTLLILFVQCDSKAVTSCLKPMTDRNSVLESMLVVEENSEKNLITCCKEILEKYKVSDSVFDY